MSVLQSCLLILMPTLCGWLLHAAYLKLIFWPYHPKKYFGVRVSGMLPRYKPQLAKSIATVVGRTYFNEPFLEEKIKYNQLSLQLKPEIENLVDVFLKDKLPQSFPMLFNLMGEKTLLKFKGVFMDEVENTLPLLMKNASNKLLENSDLEKSIEKTILEIPMPMMAETFRRYASKEVTQFKWIGAAAGFVIGLLQCIILAIVT